MYSIYRCSAGFELHEHDWAEGEQYGHGEDSQPECHCCAALLLRFPCFEYLEQFQIERQRLSHPSCALCVIALGVVRVGMDESGERAAIDHQPGNKGAELL